MSQLQAMQQHMQSDKILWNVAHVQAQSHTKKHDLAVVQLQAMERIGLVLFHVACSAVAANHTTDNSQSGF